MAYFALYPNMQEKCAEEINRVLGHKRPLYEHKKDMPYLEACIMECQRMACVLPAPLLHVTLQDIHFGGYRIPKGTWMMYSIYQFHMDPAVWGDPEVMRPERFLNEEETAVIKRDQFIPFGMGKRVCLGESLARMELFLFTVHILRKYKVCLPSSHPEPDLAQCNEPALRHLKNVHVQFIKR